MRACPGFACVGTAEHQRVGDEKTIVMRTWVVVIHGIWLTGWGGNVNVGEFLGKENTGTCRYNACGYVKKSGGRACGFSYICLLDSVIEFKAI